jgi:transcription initiation factor IIF auxiliary subunit
LIPPPNETATSEALQRDAARKSLLGSIASLKEQQKAIREQRKANAKSLKNAQRRKTRLKRKARELSNDDLLQVLTMREEDEKEKRSGKATEDDEDGEDEDDED